MIFRICEDPIFDRIIIDGEPGLQQAAELLVLVREAKTAGKSLYVDVSELIALSFPVLQVLAAAVKEYRKEGRGVVFSPLSPSCEKVLETAGLQRILSGCDKSSSDGGYNI